MSLNEKRVFYKLTLKKEKKKFLEKIYFNHLKAVKAIRQKYVNDDYRILGDEISL